MDSRADLEKAVSEASRAFNKAQWDLKIFLCDSHQSVNPADLDRLKAASDQRKARLEEVERRLAEFDQPQLRS
jgi:hypothetical protein